jgi:hypothetical protein
MLDTLKPFLLVPVLYAPPSKKLRPLASLGIVYID